jgi:hypothetical protein
MVRRFWLVLVLLAVGPACSHQEPTAPTPNVNADVAGLWADGAGSGVYRWDLHQSGTTVQGVESSTAGPDGGTITGSVAGNVFTLEQEMSRTRDDGFLHYRVHGQLTVNRGSMSGQLTYVPLFEARTISQDVNFVRLLTRP